MSFEDEKIARAREHMIIKLRIEANPDGGPARDIPLRGHRKALGRYVSSKTGRAMKWESFHERHLMWIAESDPQVVSYMEQPHKLTFALDGRTLRYTPDMLRIFADGRKEVIEVKRTRKEAEREEFYAEKLAIAEEGYRLKRMTFRIMTAEDDIEVEPLFSNAKLIQTDRFVRYSSLDELRLLEAISNGGAAVAYANAIEILSAAGDRHDPNARARLHAMIVARVASLDIAMPIRPDSPVCEIQGARGRRGQSRRRG